MSAHLLILFIVWATVSLDFLDLAASRVGTGTPQGWKTREIRGQRPPAIEVRKDSAGLAFRMEGAGKAGWFYRELPTALPEAKGALHWSWRVLDAPATADMRVEALDDSPIRVYVVFGRPGLFGRSARSIFYTFGNAEPSSYERASYVSDKLHVIRIDGAAERGSWREHSIDPFADYRRIWKGAPPSITAVGVMQDTDQTRAGATAEIRRLEWIGEPSGRP